MWHLHFNGSTSLPYYNYISPVFKTTRKRVMHFRFHLPWSVSLSLSISMSISSVPLWVLALLFCLKGSPCSKCILCCHIPQKIPAEFLYIWLCSLQRWVALPRSQTLSSGTTPALTWTPVYEGLYSVLWAKSLSSCEAMALFDKLSSFTFIFTPEAGKPTRFDPQWAGSCYGLRNLSKAVTD